LTVVDSACELGVAGPHELTLTVGNFDGLHLGHREVLRELTISASSRGAVSVAVTFDPHPLGVVAPGRSPSLLTPKDETVERLGETNLDALLIVDFTTETSIASPKSFLSSLGVGRGTHLVLGYNFRMGRDRSCDLRTLSALGAEIGYGLDVVPPVEYEGEPISSSRIRACLSEGELEAAEAMLGRPYDLSGTVIRGNGIGRRLSCPTANLSLPKDKLLPLDGVYFVSADNRDGHPGLLYIGSRPTFGEGGRRAEVHLLDLDLDLYGEQLRVRLHRRLRGDLRFKDAAALEEQIARDLAVARKLLPGVRS
jgi:riboflavin kinase/FMN adenylyltransferase